MIMAWDGPGRRANIAGAHRNHRAAESAEESVRVASRAGGKEESASPQIRLQTAAFAASVVGRTDSSALSAARLLL